MALPGRHRPVARSWRRRCSTRSGASTCPDTAEEDRVITKREEEVLQLIADGCSTPEVAEQLYISQKTVKNHLASIYQKLDARDRTQAVLQAVRMGIVHLDLNLAPDQGLREWSTWPIQVRRSADDTSLDRKPAPG